MSEIQIFNFNNQNIRTKQINNEPYFLAVDICRALEYTNGRDAVSNHCNSEGVATSDTLTDGGVQKLTYINEPNLYRLIIKSKMQEAKKFEKWVFEEVLPQIRKTGKYEVQNFQVPTTYIEALETALQLAKEKETLKIENQQKDETIKQVSKERDILDVLHGIDNEDIMTLETAGKKLHLMPRKFISMLREMKYLKTGKGNYPYQAYLNAGYFVLKGKKVKYIKNGDAKEKLVDQVYVTVKGLRHFEKNVDQFTEIAMRDLREKLIA